MIPEKKKARLLQGFDLAGEAAIEEEIRKGNTSPGRDCGADLILNQINSLSDGRRKLKEELRGFAAILGAGLPEEADSPTEVIESRGFLNHISHRIAYEVRETEEIRLILGGLLAIFGVSDEGSLNAAVKQHNACACGPKKGA